MQRNTLIIGGLAALTLSVGGGVAIAQQSGQQAPAQARAHRGDMDGDGRISRAEFVERRTARLARLDADRDGTVAPQEMQAARAQRAAARFDRVDADKNGVISREEFASARPEGRGQRAHRGGPRHRGMGHRGPRAEAVAERAPRTIAEVQSRAGQAFDRMDADRDGYLTAEERRAAFQAKRAERLAARAASQGAPASE